jgi:hypothetical protein
MDAMVKSEKRTVIVQDQMQKYYQYECIAPVGKNFDPEFAPDLTPKDMLRMGVFGGKYMNDCKAEFPDDWFTDAKMSLIRDPALNCFGVNASQSLSEWKQKGWISQEDPRGWFQWYCRYYMGRRITNVDRIQISRWKAIRRHIAQLKIHCRPGDLSCRPVQRQALLHWAYDSRKI